MNLVNTLKRNPEDLLIAFVLVTVPFHAFLTVWLANIVGHYTLLRLWPEFVLLSLALWALYVLATDRALRQRILGTRLAKLLIAFLGLTLLLGVIAYLREEVSTKALFYGILLNVRFLVWFAVAWVAASRSDWLARHWQNIVFIPLAVVSVFAVLQFFILPPDFLGHFGYDAQTTIPPAQTINQDTHTIRAQSTLRGPNPLGAYLVIGIGLLAVSTMLIWKKLLLALASVVALLVSFSRSAWLGLAATITATSALLLNKKQLTNLAIAATVSFVILVGLAFTFRNNGGVQNAVFHVDNTQTTAETTSDEGHLSAVRQSTSEVLHEPLGRGPGTAGPASVYNLAQPSRNSENYFLNVGQELGWVGLGLFVWILAEVLRALLALRTGLARGLAATFIGLVIINMLSYAWADVTVAYLWWGLAGITLGTTVHQKKTQR
ncbi:O-antigen ligase family protein [Candidatus Saccharibacteria bacterium]|nr:O-antigen ligase family protein [Candidatus Saccharibacteria bacterium]